MANDREFIIQPLITDGKVVKLADIDPETSYLQVGVWQDNQRQAGSSSNSYPSYVIPLSELAASGPKVFRAHIDNDPGGVNPIVMTVLEDTLSQGGGYTLSSFGANHQIKFGLPVLTANKTAVPSSGDFAGLLAQDLSGNILQSAEVFYVVTSVATVDFFAFNLGGPAVNGVYNKHYLEILVFP